MSDRTDIVHVMTADERASLLSYISGYAPEVFGHALTSYLKPELRADLCARVAALDEERFSAEVIAGIGTRITGRLDRIDEMLGGAQAALDRWVGDVPAGSGVPLGEPLVSEQP